MTTTLVVWCAATAFLAVDAMLALSLFQWWVMRDRSLPAMPGPEYRIESDASEKE